MVFLVTLMARHATDLAVRQQDFLRQAVLGAVTSGLERPPIGSSNRMVGCTAAATQDDVPASAGTIGAGLAVVAAQALQGIGIEFGIRPRHNRMSVP